jgi:hypothetical protein
MKKTIILSFLPLILSASAVSAGVNLTIENKCSFEDGWTIEETGDAITEVKCSHEPHPQFVVKNQDGAEVPFSAVVKDQRRGVIEIRVEKEHVDKNNGGILNVSAAF